LRHHAAHEILENPALDALMAAGLVVKQRSANRSQPPGTGILFFFAICGGPFLATQIHS